MNKSELVASVAEKANLTKADAARALDAVLDSIKDSVVAGDPVQLVGFGTFKISERKARTGRNPQTGEAIKIAASKAPVFSAGKAFKEAANAKKKKK